MKFDTTCFCQLVVVMLHEAICQLPLNVVEEDEDPEHNSRGHGSVVKLSAQSAFY